MPVSRGRSLVSRCHMSACVAPKYCEGVAVRGLLGSVVRFPPFRKSLQPANMPRSPAPQIAPLRIFFTVEYSLAVQADRHNDRPGLRIVEVVDTLHREGCAGKV